MLLYDRTSQCMYSPHSCQLPGPPPGQGGPMMQPGMTGTMGGRTVSSIQHALDSASLTRITADANAAGHAAWYDWDDGWASCKLIFTSYSAYSLSTAHAARHDARPAWNATRHAGHNGRPSSESLSYVIVRYLTYAHSKPMQGPPGGMQPGMQGTMGGRPVSILCGLLLDDDLTLTADDATWHAAWSDGNHGRATGESIVLDGRSLV